MMNYEVLTNVEDAVVKKIIKESDELGLPSGLDMGTIDTAIIVCSDSRHPPQSVYVSGSLVISNAGNQLLYDELPTSIKNITVIGHETFDDEGCGACKEAANLSNKTEQDIEDLRNVSPEVVRVALTAKPSVRANLSKIEQKTGLTYTIAVFNHVNMGLDKVLPVITSTLEGFNSKLFKANNIYLKEIGDSPSGHHKNFDLTQGQNPFFIVFNNTPYFFSQYFGKDMAKKNAAYEVKQVGKMPSDFSVGSLDYAFLHALGEKGSFKDTDKAVFLVNNEGELKKTLGRMSLDSALEGFVKKGGKIYAAIPEQNKLQFYKVK